MNLRSPAPHAGAFNQATLLEVTERPAGVEPALPPWQGSRLPLHHGRIFRKQLVKDNHSEPGGTRTLTTRVRAGNAAASTSSSQVGSEGLEPSPQRLKAACAAVTPRPCQNRHRRAFPSSLSHGLHSHLRDQPSSVTVFFSNPRRSSVAVYTSKDAFAPHRFAQKIASELVASGNRTQGRRRDARPAAVVIRRCRE